METLPFSVVGNPSFLKPFLSSSRRSPFHTRIGVRRISTVKIVNSRESDAYFSTDSRPIMLFDGVCNLCNGGVKFIRDNDTMNKLRYEALQSDAGRALLMRSGRLPNDISSVVLVEKQRSFIKSEAVLRILSYLNFPYPQISIFLHLVPLFLRDIVYDSVADNRYEIFGKADSCEIS